MYALTKRIGQFFAQNNGVVARTYALQRERVFLACGKGKHTQTVLLDGGKIAEKFPVWRVHGLPQKEFYGVFRDYGAQSGTKQRKGRNAG